MGAKEGLIGGGLALGGPIGGMIGLGAAAGMDPSKSETNYWSKTDAGTATGTEQQGQGWMMQGAQGFIDMANRGPGASDVDASLGATRDFASMLKDYQNGGYNPTTGDISNANSLASQLFQGQRTALSQNFKDQSVEANRNAALMGRDLNDPILRNKLAQEQTRQSAQLDANQGAWATQKAMNDPYERLNFAQNRVNVLGGLASQAMANRQAIAAMGEGIMQNERNFRLATATKYGNQSTESGGGFKGAVEGGFAAAGTMASMASSMISAARGGAGGNVTPYQSQGAQQPNIGQLSGNNYSQSPSQFFGMQQQQPMYAPAPAYGNQQYRQPTTNMFANPGYGQFGGR